MIKSYFKILLMLFLVGYSLLVPKHKQGRTVKVVVTLLNSVCL